MGVGRISLLIDSPFRDMLIVLRRVPAEARKQMLKHARSEAEPIWFEETRGRADSRIQQRVLVNSARVGVTGRNVFLRSGKVGKTSNGTPVSVIAQPAEWGAKADRPVKSKSKHGKAYTRRLGAHFGPPQRPTGNVFYPAVRDSIQRITSVIIQSARRTLFDAFDGKS